MGVYISRIWGEETPKPIWIKFGVVVDIPDVITYTNFGDHRLKGFWVARGQIFPSPIDFHRRPYNTLALPCECVISLMARQAVLCNSKRDRLARRTVVVDWEVILINS